LYQAILQFLFGLNQIEYGGFLMGMVLLNLSFTVKVHNSGLIIKSRIY
jgi:hypothetical protein